MTDDLTGHGARLTIDLAAIAGNWRLLADRARGERAGAECGAVVKADAYGCGIERVVPALWSAGCRTFFVAHLSEGRRTRSVAPDAVIYVLNGLLPGTTGHYRADRLRPVLGSVAEVNAWSIEGKGEPAALHVDTGMNRLGLAAGDLPFIGGQQQLRDMGVALVMTHLSASEDHDDQSTVRQAGRFAEVAARYQEIPGSLWNSSAHFRSGLPPYDLTRPGYALYGGNPVPGTPNPMQAAVTLAAIIVQVREVRDGDAVGYNGRWHAKGARKLATLSIGYADGYPRNASVTDTDTVGGVALVGGVPCPFAGTVSMDLIIVDVTDAPADAAQRGEPVTLIGDGLDLDIVGAGARTIGYEILTRLGARFHRSYTGH